MAPPASRLALILSPAAVDEIAEIWRWNAGHYSIAHADAYISHLRNFVAGLATIYATGKSLQFRPEWRYLALRKKAKGHCHVAVYCFDETTVTLLHIFHTAQDWRTKLTTEERTT